MANTIWATLKADSKSITVHAPEHHLEAAITLERGTPYVMADRVYATPGKGQSDYWSGPLHEVGSIGERAKRERLKALAATYPRQRLAEIGHAYTGLHSVFCAADCPLPLRGTLLSIRTVGSTPPLAQNEHQLARGSK